MIARVVEPEVMDDPSLDVAAHRDALRRLARLNNLSASAGRTYGAIRDLLSHVGRPLRVLDVACGGGDVAVGLHRRAMAAGYPIEVHGCDVSPVAVEFARESAERARAAVTFFQLDALREPLPAGYDAVTCSLFLHHLPNDQAEALLRKMAAAAGRRVIVNDLGRSRFNLALVWLATRLVTRSRVVRADGPASVRAAFTLQEVRRIAERAGLADPVIRSTFPCRFLLTWDKR